MLPWKYEMKKITRKILFIMLSIKTSCLQHALNLSMYYMQNWKPKIQITKFILKFHALKIKTLIINIQLSIFKTPLKKTTNFNEKYYETSIDPVRDNSIERDSVNLLLKLFNFF